METQKLIEMFKKYEPRTPMTEYEVMNFLNLELNSNKTFSKELNEIDFNSEKYMSYEPLINSREAKAFLAIIQESGLRITLATFIMLLGRMNNIKSILIIALFLCTKLPENSLVDMDKFAMIVFPLGWFSDAQINEIWDELKSKFNLNIAA